MKNMIQAKILRNICLVLFAEIIVSERNLMPGRQAYVDHPASVKLQDELTERLAAHRQCARDNRSLKSNDGMFLSSNTTLIWKENIELIYLFFFRCYQMAMS